MEHLLQLHNPYKNEAFCHLGERADYEMMSALADVPFLAARSLCLLPPLLDGWSV
jgi:hypothetical protein